MTEHDKLALLNMINKASDALQNVIDAEKEINELIKTAEYNNCKVIWKDYKAVKIEEKGDKENEKN